MAASASKELPLSTTANLEGTNEAQNNKNNDWDWPSGFYDKTSTSTNTSTSKVTDNTLYDMNNRIWRCSKIITRFSGCFVI